MSTLRPRSSARSLACLRPAHAAAVALVAVLACARALALDLGDAKPPVDVVDGEVSLGGRTLLLPPGHWVYVDRSLEVLNAGSPGRPRSVVETVFLMQVEGRALVASVRLALVNGDAEISDWRYACQPAGPLTIYRQDRAVPPGNADCLIVNGRREAALGKWFDGYSAVSKAWLARQGIQLPGTTISVGYLRLPPHTYGVIWVLAPAEDFDSDASAIAWAESLRGATKSMFENGVDTARMPALPVAAVPASAPASAASSPAGADGR